MSVIEEGRKVKLRDIAAQPKCVQILSGISARTILFYFLLYKLFKI